MKKVFKSKIDLLIAVPLFTVLTAVLLLSLSAEPTWMGSLVIFPIFLFIVHLFLTTHYTIDGHELNIRSGLVFRKKINIHNITKIKETNNPWSAPALSLNRLEVKYNNSKHVLISPLMKQEFLDHLTAINPKIVAQKKKTAH
jgi:hypothetical protein